MNASWRGGHGRRTARNLGTSGTADDAPVPEVPFILGGFSLGLDLLHETYLEIGPTPSAVPCARLYTRQTLEAWQTTGVIDEAELVVSELMTNAINVTTAKSLRTNVALCLAEYDGRVIVLVWDFISEQPQPHEHEDDATSGRGLEIVEAVSRQWGSTLGEHGGKVVWAVLSK